MTAYWCTPLMNLGTWSNVKTVTNVWVVGKPYSRSGGEMYFITNKDYERLGRSYNIDIFDWNDIDFNRFTFNSLGRAGGGADAEEGKENTDVSAEGGKCPSQ